VRHQTSCGVLSISMAAFLYKPATRKAFEVQILNNMWNCKHRFQYCWTLQ